MAVFSYRQVPKTKKLKAWILFFAGVPLQGPFEKWVEFISANPFLGIDSTTERGIYSSFKKGMTDIVPFPGNINVKILFGEEIVKLYNQELKADTVKALMIEGIFENSRQGEKESNIFFEQLKKLLNTHYDKTMQWNMGTTFSRGFSSQFPDCMIAKGYNDILEFPFVMLIYVDGKRVKDISPLRISKGY